MTDEQTSTEEIMAAPNFDYPQFHDSLDDIAPPCVTPDMIGHEQARSLMLGAAKSGHHALILDGEHGIGKATAAFHLGNILLGGSLDIQSQTYRQIAQNAHPNLLYLTRPLKEDGKGFKTVITVDEVRRLQRFLGMTSSGSERRVIIIDCLSDMNRNAANAILKLLEEPPANTLFLLISHGIGGLLATIRSRCQIVRFAPLHEDQVRQVLNSVGDGLLAPDEIAPLAALSGGSVRHALLMARSGGLELRESLETFLNAPNFATEHAHKLADIAATKGSDTHHDLLLQMMFENLRRHALTSAHNGDLQHADRIADFDAQLSERARVADGFNLDRRQEFLIVAAKVHELLHAR